MNLKFLLLLSLLLTQTLLVGKNYNFTIKHFYDEENNQTIQTIQHQIFKPTQTLIRFFRKPQPHWFKFVIQTSSKTPITLVLSNTKNNHNIFLFYEISNKQKVIKTVDMSKFIAYKQRAFSSNVPAYKMTLTKDNPKTIYIKIQKNVNVISQFYVEELELFYKNRAFIDTIYTAHIVATLAIAFYCLTLFFVNYSRLYIYYVLFILVLTLYTMIYSNLYFYFFSGEYIKYLIPIIPFVYIMLIYVTQEIMKFDAIKPPYFTQITSIFKIVLLISCFLLYFNISLGSSIMYLLSVIFLFYSFYLLIYTSKHHKVYFMALSLFLLSITSMPLMLFGFIEYEGVNKYLLIIGSSIELMMFSVVLSQRVYRLNREKENLGKNLLEFKERQNTLLTKEVEVKTAKINLLFKELQHRVKNNFQFILTFLWMQESSTHDTKVLHAIKQTKDRVYAISSIHELLYVNKTNSLDVGIYFKKIIHAFEDKTNIIQIEQTIEEVTLDYNDSMALGLILNELLTNSYKYAFKDIKKPLIKLILTKRNRDIYFTYCDNGRGFDKKYLEESQGFGYEFIKEFSYTLLNNDFKIHTEKGFTFKLRFSMQ